MWIRLCPLCKATLQKYSLREAIRCCCGWVW
jgi:hypothetical protein